MTAFSERSEVHLWSFSLERGPRGAAALGDLSPEEREHAGRFRARLDAERFISGRAALRWILGGYLGLTPRAVPLGRGPGGKPELAGAGLHFNFSHSESAALLAVSRLGPLGVDLERLRPVPEAAELADSLLPEAERRWVLDAPAQERSRRFLQVWARHEAYLKALGTGLGRELPRARSAAWQVLDLVVPGHAAALAARGRIGRVRRFE